MRSYGTPIPSMAIKWSVSALSIFCVSGCTILEYSTSKPIIHRQADATTGSDIFAIGAERRVIVSQPESSTRRFCSEPPPDVAQSFADSVRAALQVAAQQQTTVNQSNQRTVEVPSAAASVPGRSQSANQEGSAGQSASGSGSLSLARDFATSISQIYTRSQGVQLFRDGSFMLCQAHLNNALRGDKRDITKDLDAVKRTAQRLDAIDNAQRGMPAPGEGTQISEKSIEAAKVAVEALDDKNSNDLNYSQKFTELLNTVHAVLLVEVPNLYRYDVEKAKTSATEAAQAALESKTRASASAAEAGQSAVNAGLARDQALQSAAKSAESSASAVGASLAAKKSADDAKASADGAPKK